MSPSSGILSRGLAAFRAALFYLSFGLFTAFWSIVILIFIHPFPDRMRHYYFIRPWAGLSVYLAKWFCGITWKVEGRENIPTDRPFIVISNHQSTWETFFLQMLISPQATVLKKELLRIPFFGWGMAMARPIAINRNDPRLALSQLREQGVKALQKGLAVLVFPEGTRVAAGKLGKFSKGAAGLAKAADVPVLPITHNAGVYWPNHSWLKSSGCVKVVISPLIETSELNLAEVNNAAHDVIENTMKSI